MMRDLPNLTVFLTSAVPHPRTPIGGGVRQGACRGALPLPNLKFGSSAPTLSVPRED
jgi:hypothetical protein